MSAETKLIEEMKIALHGVETFLRQLLDGDEQLSTQAYARGKSLRTVVSRVLEKTTGYGKPALLSPSPSTSDVTMPPDLPSKPAIDPVPKPLETMEPEFIEGENYEEMDALQRPRIDTSASLYAPMASIPMNEAQAVSEETYEAMSPSPGHSGSGQVTRPGATDMEDIANITEELYLEMDGAAGGQHAATISTTSLAQKPPMPVASSQIASLGISQAEDGFEGEEYTAMGSGGQEGADDFYEAPAPVKASSSSLNSEANHVPARPNAHTLPASASASNFEVNDDDDPYAYQIPVQAQKISAEALSSASQRGYLDKLGGRKGQTWQKRFVVLSEGCMYYFEGEKDKKPRNVVPISGYRVEEDPDNSKGKKYAFKVTPLSADKTKTSTKSAAKGKGGKMYHFRANSFEEREGWVSALRLALVRANRRSQTFLDAAVESEPSGSSASGSVISGGSSSQQIIEEDLYEDPLAAPTGKQTVVTPPIEMQDDYLAPAELPTSPPPSNISAPADTYLPSVETKARASSTFGIGKEIETANLGESNPYASRKEANPYASRQQMKLPSPPPVGQENPYQTRKQTQPLPKAPADSNPYASRQQVKLPPLPDKPPAPVAPMAPIAPRAPVNDQIIINTQAIFVQKADAKFKFEQVFVALWDYQPSASDELGFRRGDLLYIEDIIQDTDWWVGRKKSAYDEDTFTGDRGLLVSTYVSPAYEKLI
eukprot:scpid8868/ scgid5350/ Cytohesin-1; PH, SEC7 and coiled-coil domain-containing protein 1; SEC7 homolog A; Cytohesin-1; PH, SEC7 and coiled-coil domain-containing protein 1; SEC7 homolog A